MVELFKGFLWLRFIGLVVLLIVVGLVFGIRSLTRGSDAVGVVLLASVLVVTVVVGSLVIRRVSRRPHRL